MLIASAVIATTSSSGKGSAPIVPTEYAEALAHSVAVPEAEQLDVDPVVAAADDLLLDNPVDDTAVAELLALGESEGSGFVGFSIWSVIGAPTPPPPPQDRRQGSEKLGNLGRPGNVRPGNTVLGN